VSGKARSAVIRALPICCALLAIGSVVRTAQGSGPDEPAPPSEISKSEIPKQVCPPAADITPAVVRKPPVVVKQPDPRSLYVDVTCEVSSQPVQPIVIPVPTPPNGTWWRVDREKSVPPAPAPADPPSAFPAVVIAEWVVLGLILVIAVWLAFLGARLMGPKGLAAATDAFLFRRHWGGFGGENSGWNLSAPAGKCVAGLLLIALSTGLAVQMLLVLHKHTQAESDVVTQQDPAEKPQGTDAGAATAEQGKLTAAAPDSPG